MARRPVVPAELKNGPFTLDEALAAGLTRRQLQGSTWRRIGTGVYVWAGLPETPSMILRAVQRRIPAEAALSGLTAAWVHGLDVSPHDRLEATIPDGCGVSALAGISVRRAALPPGDVVEREGIRVTSPLRTAADLGIRPPLVEAVVVADMALQRRLVDLADLRAYAAAHSCRRGIAQLRRVIELAEPATESPMETRLRLLLVLAGLPRPKVQVPLEDSRGRFLGRPDLYYPAQRLGLEYDGGTHRASMADDNRRQNRLLSAGFRLLRFTAGDVLRSPDLVVAQVRTALRAA